MISLRVLLVALCFESTKSTSTPTQDITILEARNELTENAFRYYKPRPDLHSIPCFSCVLEECPQVRTYGANETIYMKCLLRGNETLYYESVDGCYIQTAEFDYHPHPKKRESAADPICDEDKAFRLPNATPTSLKRRAEPRATATYVPAIVSPEHDQKCRQCADPLCVPDSTLPKNSSIDLECWTTSTLGPGEVISFPTYDNHWVMTKEGCYLALSEVKVLPPACSDIQDYDCHLEYCEPAPHYWAFVKDYTLARTKPVNGSIPKRDLNNIYIVDFECWDYGDLIQGNNTWYKSFQVQYGNSDYWHWAWWPKASLGNFGGTGEPKERCASNATDPDDNRSSQHRRRSTSGVVSLPSRDVEIRAAGHAHSRSLLNIYASVNALDTRCRFGAKRIYGYRSLYQPGESIEFFCFVYGSVVDGSNIWLKTTEKEACYVPKGYATLTGGSSISYCRDGGEDSNPPTLLALDEAEEKEEGEKPSIVQRAPVPQVTDPSQDPHAPWDDTCRRFPANWEQVCYNHALACCVQRDPDVGSTRWSCTFQQSIDAWKAACHDLRTQTNCTIASELGQQMEGCIGGDIYRDPTPGT